MTKSVYRLPTEAETDRRRLTNEGVTFYEVHVTPEGEPLRRRPAITLKLSRGAFTRRYGSQQLHFPGSVLASTDDEEVAEAICHYWNAGKQRVALHGEAWIFEVQPEDGE